MIDNNRYDSLQFDIDLDTVLHGFGGYFYCVLYADIVFSMSYTYRCRLVVIVMVQFNCLGEKLHSL